MKKTSIVVTMLVAVSVFAFSSVGTAWAKAVEIKIDEDSSDRIYSVEASDVPEGLTLHTGWDYSLGEPQKDATTRFKDFIYKDYGGDAGANEAEDRGKSRVNNELDCDEDEDEECYDAYMRIMVEEAYTKMGEKIMWNSPEDYYLLDGDDKKYSYDGEGMTIIIPFKEKDDLIEMLDKYFGDYELLMLHEKYDEDNDTYTYEYLPATLIEYDVNGDKKDAIRFTTKSLSPFAMVVSGKTLETPKTSDDTISYLGLAAISLVTFVSFGAYIRGTRR